MRILGIDPGYAIVGYGVLEFDNTRFKVINYGAITTESDTPFDKRLAEIYDDMCRVLDMFKPDCMSIEKLYFNTNITTGIDVAQYTPLQVKVAVTGYGRAEKQQMQEMTKNILHLKEVPKPDDTADALAIAICHGHTGGSKMSEIMRANEVKQLNKKR